MTVSDTYVPAPGRLRFTLAYSSLRTCRSAERAMHTQNIGGRERS